ncbi:hypothetical protein [Tellurirhabdus rosea]|uniref:hypothetical protein n=1 Tax=Tellurirhabdus rosea TaxID=2674997 RepID=UPI0022502DDC|nr:hypothetical protein [Tellurirhabdus rosea]
MSATRMPRTFRKTLILLLLLSAIPALYFASRNYKKINHFGLKSVSLSGSTSNGPSDARSFSVPAEPDTARPPAADELFAKGQGNDPKLSGADSRGRRFTTETAPRLPLAPLRKFPRQADNQYRLTEQNAEAAFLVGRFPPIQTGRQKLLYFGPTYPNTPYALHQSRGLLTSGTVRSGVPGASGPTQHWIIYGGPLYNAAAVSAQTHLPLEVRRQAAAWAGKSSFEFLKRPIPADVASVVTNEPMFPDNEQTLMEVGRDLYGQWRAEANPPWKYLILDIEGGKERHGDWMREVGFVAGNVQKGLMNAYRQDRNRPPYAPVWITYGIWSFDVRFDLFSQYKNGLPGYYTGYPPAFSPLNEGLFESLRTSRGAISMDSYVKCVWPLQSDFFQRDSRDRVVMQNGRPVISRATQPYRFAGRTYPISEGEAEHMLHETYGTFGKIQAMLWHLNGNQYPERTDSRAARYKGIELATWERHTQELGVFISELTVNNPYNYRPVPGWMLEGLGLLKMFLGRYYLHWSFPSEPQPGQTDPAPDSEIPGSGSREAFLKAAHRMSLVRDAYDADGEWLFFKHAYVERNSIEGEHFHQKPLVFGKLYTDAKTGKPCLAITGWFPAQRDNERTTLRIFVNNGKAQSAAYPIVLTGRDAAAVRWQLPDNFRGLRARDVYCAFRDLGDAGRIWRGDLREKVPGNLRVPADFRR